MEKASIKHLIANNPSGLLEMKPSVSIPEYRDNYGFGLQRTHSIFQSKRYHNSGKDWFDSPGIKSLSELIRVEEESNGDLLVVYIAEVVKEGRVYCYLVLSDQAWTNMVNNKNQHILQVYQMYTQFFTDNIALNMAIA